MSPLPLLGLALLALLMWLANAQWQANTKRHDLRARYFESLSGLFDRCLVQIQPSGFARMTGHQGSHAFDLQAIPDSLTFRKLPALWVMLTLPEVLPVRATLDVMARPTGNEPFSHFATLPQALETPDFLPGTTSLRSDNAALIRPEVLAAHARIFDDPRVKELVISPKGLRLVILAEEADRGRFLLFRDAEMALLPLNPQWISELLETLLALRSQVLAMEGKT